MPSIAPAGKPRLSTAELIKLIEPFGLDREKYPVIVVGVRWYYRDTLGAPGVNDRGIYDDAIFLHTPSVPPLSTPTPTPRGIAREPGSVPRRAWRR